MTSVRATAAVLLVCIFGSLLFLAAIGGGRKLMCSTHHNGLRYCPGYVASTR